MILRKINSANKINTQKININKKNEKHTQAVGSTLNPQWIRHSVDTRRRATTPFFSIYKKKIFFIGGK